MTTQTGLGNFINGTFIKEGSISLTSENPSCDFEPVLCVKTDAAHVPLAIRAARDAHKSWTYLTTEQRIKALLRLKDTLQKNEAAMADAISLEMGKIKSEALIEAKGLSARIDLVVNHGLKRVENESLYDLRASTRYQNQGVLAVIGPYNFPAHLINSHVIPSLILGNTVIIKPSEVCPLVAQIYAQCVEQANLPKGVINVIHGDRTISKTLCEHNDIDGVIFTGSYRAGRAISEALLHQPHKILALEMGGKNFSLVMDDADLNQAMIEIIQAAFLTTGQRCTATSRVLVHERVYERFRTMMVSATKKLKPCMPNDNGFFGPLATKAALENFMNGLKIAKEEGAQVLIESERLGKGAFVTPSIYEVQHSDPLKNYLGEELFGPNIALEAFSTFDDAIARVNQSSYGLSNAIFTFNEKNCDRMMRETKSGLLNINRSTNNAFGQMPFGGLNKSGNQRPAGIDAVRYVTYPMAVMSLPYGASVIPKHLHDNLSDLVVDQTPLAIVTLRHEIEAIFENFGIYADMASGNYLSFSTASWDGIGDDGDKFSAELAQIFSDAVDVDAHRFVIDLSRLRDHAPVLNALGDMLQRYASQNALSLKKFRGAAINVPNGLEIPRSRAMLDRLYKGQFFPAEKKTLVADLKRSRGPFLVSVDDDPLVLFDAASQIATLGAGFAADTFQNAYDRGDFDLALMRNADLSLSVQNENCGTYKDAVKAKQDFEAFLNDKTKNRFKFIAYGASGGEANEIAFDLARLNGPGGTRIIAFEGSFHGRTIMALQATYNKEKRGPFAFAGYEATFLPFPELKDPSTQPAIDKEILAALSRGQIPKSPSNDPLLAQELQSLQALKDEVAKGNICTVIIEPMQCEGGDRYASDRFFSGLRALTRALNVPLIFDEVQTGFHLGREFFWHQQMNLIDHHGQPDFPDCMTLAKKAQLGVCMSVWKNQRVYTPHVLQLKRGLLHAQTLLQHHSSKYEDKARQELMRLQDYFPDLIMHPRACGYAFAFDMPTKALATELVDQRFHRGFMAYIAGENTLRFRLNTSCDDEIIHRLFENLFLALVDIRDRTKSTRVLSTKTSEPAKSALSDIAIRVISAENFGDYRAKIEAIENATYEEGRRDSMEVLHGWLKHKDSLGLLMTCKRDNGDEMIAAYAFGGPLEHAKADGATSDIMHGKNNSFYSANITVQEALRGFRLGSLLKNEQVKLVSAMRNADKSPRYLYMSGRNRVGRTSAMNQINDNLGAYLVSTHDNQYNEKGAQAIYYRLPVVSNRHNVDVPKPSSLDCQNSVQRIFKHPPKALVSALEHNQMRSIACSKLTLSNWATPHLVRYSELLRALMPKHLKHAYFTSGRDEVLDKGLRCLRYHRPEADIAIGFSHQWFGHSSAAARSLSHDDDQAQPFAFFKWPKVAHPDRVGNEESLKALRLTLENVAPEKVLGIVVELIGERSGFTFDNAYLAELDAIRKKTGIPLVFVENASSYYRNGLSLFMSDSLDVKANMVMWYTGGQLGHVMVDDRYYTDKPLTLISTWDGDEVSIARAYHSLRTAAELSPHVIANFESALEPLKAHAKIYGRGLWRALSCASDQAVADAQKLARDRKIYFGAGFDRNLMICPKLDFSADEMAAVINTLNDIVKVR